MERGLYINYEGIGAARLNEAKPRDIIADNWVNAGGTFQDFKDVAKVVIIEPNGCRITM